MVGQLKLQSNQNSQSVPSPWISAILILNFLINNIYIYKRCVAPKPWIRNAPIGGCLCGFGHSLPRL